MLLISAATSFRHKNPSGECVSNLDAVAQMSFDELKNEALAGL